VRSFRIQSRKAGVLTMPKIVVEATENGLVVPPELLREVGAEPGRMVEIEIRQLPRASDIHHLAYRYAAENLGNALGLSIPRFVNGEWVVTLVSPDGSCHVGTLYLNQYGEVDTGRSATYESVREGIHVARPPRPAA